MSNFREYYVLARRYRPRFFSDIFGNKAVLETLKSFFDSKKIPHAFLLHGAHGVGKTTVARILACAFLYSDSSYDAPLFDFPKDGGKHSKKIFSGTHPDVLEIDAASHSLLKETRMLVDGLQYRPLEARYKVCILDEVHMLSPGSFNALLKHVEEPFDHVKFIFATTSINSIPLTMQSRCQKLFFNKASHEDVLALLRKVAEQEKVDLHDSVIKFIANQPHASFRDALFSFEGIVNRFEEGKYSSVTIEDISDILGVPKQNDMRDLYRGLLKQDINALYSCTTSLLRSGIHAVSIIEYLMKITRDLICHILNQDICYVYDTAFYTEIISFLPPQEKINSLLNIFSMLVHVNEKISQNCFDRDTFVVMLLCHVSQAVDIISVPSVANILKNINQVDQKAFNADPIIDIFRDVLGPIHDVQVDK